MKTINKYDIPGMTTTGLPISTTRNSDLQKEWEKIIANYTSLDFVLKSGRVPTTVTGCMRLN